MRFTATAIEGVWIIDPEVSGDARGFFLESYNVEAFRRHGIDAKFIQDNHSGSRRGVVRGLHYQLPPRAQAKLVRVIRGAAYDVAVDIRRGSPTFGRWVAETLSESNRKMMYIPTGFAHGFMALEDRTEFLYKVSDAYAPESQRGILWDDPRIGIHWPDPGAPLVLSDKDRTQPTLEAAELP
ncbi:MAG: dTDP-4-dehydrorhamnose 3,5-epimerase [Candidatus Omnitrophica bacterium]|nr:dTDP-4-dehydrorhamnose 3,5-epimerase [Candidatus Omnitrophota bacterium]